MHAAIWTAGDPPNISMLSHLLKDVQFSVAADAGGETATKLGYSPDYWVGDADSGSPLRAIPPENLYLLNRDKDVTDAEFAVSLALRLGATRLSMLGGGGRRMDHWLYNLELMRRTPEIRNWVTGYELATRLQAPSEFELKPGIVSVFALDRHPGKLRATGLKWPIDDLNFASHSSLSNLVGNLGGKIDVLEGLFILIQPFDES